MRSMVPRVGWVLAAVCIAAWAARGAPARPPAPATRPAAVGIKFVDAAAGNFQLRDDSPVWKEIGFGRIPTDRIGLEVHELRDSQLRTCLPAGRLRIGALVVQGPRRSEI